MNAVTRFDVKRQAQRSVGSRIPIVLPPLLILVACVAFLLAFQLFLRYQYITESGVVWRIDRLTQQACRVKVGGVICAQESANAAPAPKRLSTSTSTSTSTSLSVSVKPALPKKD